MKTFDAIVVGGGHAGCEAAHAIARLGIETLLLTMNIDTIGHMSCNPAMGGLAKSQLVREVDALGGLIARIADASAIQYRRLNMSKGPAVRATRCQCDMRIYRQKMQQALFQTPNLTIKQGTADKFVIANGRVSGVVTRLGQTFEAAAVVLTTGTFLRGLCHVGMRNFDGGRAGSKSAVALAEVLSGLGLDMGRLKTGTTPRLDGRTIDWSVTTEQPSESTSKLSYYYGTKLLPQRSCFITYTNEDTHQIIRSATDQSPMFTGKIEGVGPRYCPSIEDKVVRFPDRHRHQVFLEPHGLDTPEIYPNGLSTSLPIEVQERFVRSISGLENARITRPGYAVEYDFVQPTQLAPTLALKALPGLYLAGQINGTSGYEEAAAQGLMAGLNVAREIRGEDPVVLARDQAYIGVLIDDLVTLGTQEPYRMFTSRAEFRLLLREDNADERLSEIGRSVGLLPDAAFEQFTQKMQAIESLTSQVRRVVIPVSPGAQKIVADRKLGGLSKAITGADLLSRPGSSLGDLAAVSGQSFEGVSPEVAEAVEIRLRYRGYIERQKEQAARFHVMEDREIPDWVNYRDVSGLSAEVVEKLASVKPITFGQAVRISGVTPAAITNLMVYINSRKRAGTA